MPPEENQDPHISSKIVQEIAAEFDISSYEAMETDTLNKELEQNAVSNGMVIKSTGPVEAREDPIEEMEQDGDNNGIVCCNPKFISINFK